MGSSWGLLGPFHGVLWGPPMGSLEVPHGPLAVLMGYHGDSWRALVDGGRQLRARPARAYHN
eukprot:109661-Pyramimonas_sp.AAC.1